MGSQVIYNARKESPRAIVVVERRPRVAYRVAKLRDAVQYDQRHGGIGPVALVYELGPRRRSYLTALAGATKILIEQEQEQR